MLVYKPIIAKSHTPPYKIHRYFARRPWNVFSKLIDLYSDNSDLVLDPFCGGGVTIYEGLKKNRKVIGFDLNPLSIFIVKNMVKRDYNKKILKTAYSKINSYLEFLYSSSENIELESKKKTHFPTFIKEEWNELAFEVKCHLCGTRILLSNGTKIKNGRYSCPNKSCKGNEKNVGFIEPKDCERIGYKYLFSVYKSPISNKLEYINFDDNRLDKINKHIEFLMKELEKEGCEIPKDKIPLNWDRQHEDLLYKKGIKTFQDLFTKRNLILNLLLQNFIKKLDVDKKMREILNITFSSSLRDTNIMSFTNKSWQSGRPTTWSKHAYWIPNQFCEVNVLDSFKKAYRRVKSALDYNQQFDYDVKLADNFIELGENNILLINDSIENSNIPKNSIDAIITDPPYGSNVQYLELSHFWYPWNKDLYENKPNFAIEAVVNRKRNFKDSKSLWNYEDNLYRVFKKCYEVLKPGKYMVLTFNNKDIGAWLALMFSIFRAGFDFVDEGLFFYTGVKNYKQTAHTKYKGSPYGDFIYVFMKSEKKRKYEVILDNEDSFIKELDRILIKHINVQNLSKKEDKNELIREIILEIIPVIEIFVKTKLKNTQHSIYEKYKKNHLDKIYGGKYGTKKRK